MNLGERIKALRKAKSWTQSELAERCEITLRTVQRIESSAVKPSPFSLKKLSEVLETDLSECLTEVTEIKSQTSNSVKPMNTFFQPIGSFLRRNPFLTLGFIGIITALFIFQKSEKLALQAFDFTTVNLETINCGTATECDISLTKFDKSGKVLWQKTFGGSSYDRAGQVLKTLDQGYLIVGSTSSFGNGNYDVLLIKVSADGLVQWQQTYGEFFNEYGKSASNLASGIGFEIKGTQQTCTTPNVSNDCQDSVWKFEVDENGQVLS